MTYLLLLCLAGALLLGFLQWRQQRRMQQRAHLLGAILDLADALERELMECRARMREVPALTTSLRDSGEVSAQATLTAEPQVQDALRDLLAHRLWLKEHATSAPLAELQASHDALAATRHTLATQLSRLAKVRNELEQTLADSDPSSQHGH